MFVACMLKGLTPSYLPFPTPKQDPELYFASHKTLFERTQPAAIITYDELMESLVGISPQGADLISLNSYVHDGYYDASNAMPAPTDIALLQHSSGTTGLKKGVALTYGQIARQVESYAGSAKLDASSTVASWLPLYHDMGLLTSFLIPMSVGASVVSLSAFEWVKDPGLLLKVIEIFNCTHTWLPNFAFSHIVKAVPPEAEFNLSSMQAFISCSEPPKAVTMRAFAERFGPSGAGIEKLQACYAMAETVFAVSQHPLGKPNRVVAFDAKALGEGAVVSVAAAAAGAQSLVSNGPLVSGIKAGVLLADGKIDASVNSPAVGEIVVSGDFVFEGYYRNPIGTTEAFTGEWYKTGDLGFLLGGELYVCGRTKDVIIVHGRNYYAHDIEEIASTLSGVIPGRAVAIGIDDPVSASEEVLLLVESSLEGENTAEHKALRRELKRAIFERLELTPKDVGFVQPGWLVKTTSGKLSRVENLARYRALQAANS
ncbi:acyl-CoA synthetase (AMP-forming)/AMP-acid ligase II [Caulobacter sp. BE254]|nr:acyl-CoA synthetase (AMP-forming)/AMP-acid ligase II [Caulobacter sp. BE254]